MVPPFKCFLVGCIDSGISTISKTLALKYGLTYVNVENAILRWEKENSNGEIFQNVCTLSKIDPYDVEIWPCDIFRTIRQNS